MTEKEPKLSPENKLVILKEELIKQLNKKTPGVSVSIVRSETEGGTLGLTLDNKGEWIGRVQMMGIPMGTNPDVDSLLDMYARVTEESYRFLEKNGDWILGEPKRKEYIQINRERLLNGLLENMESVLQFLPPLQNI